MANNDDLIMAKLGAIETLLSQRLESVEGRVDDHESRLRIANDLIIELRTQSGLAHIGQTAFTLIVSVVAFVTIRVLQIK